MDTNPLLPNSDESSIRNMLDAIGASSIDDLFSDVPEHLLWRNRFSIPHAKSEYEIEREIEETLSKNVPYENLCFLGGGCYSHYIPAVVDELASRSEFLTSYTQYQPESSQGMLQALFEYQSMICDLTGMEIANSSMYDWATSLGEASRMAMRINGRKKILTFDNVGHERLQVLRTYTMSLGMNLEIISSDIRGRADLHSLTEMMSEEVSSVYLETPNFFGIVEDEVDDIAGIVHRKGGLFVVGIEPISLGLLREPGTYGADIVVGDGQTLGIHMNLGGPTLGILASRGDKSFVRQMPGRIIGSTTAENGTRTGYATIMQTREQHIRRENATSNICTNQALSAVTACIYLSLLGGDGLGELARSIASKTQYTARLLAELPGVAMRFESPIFREFVLQVENSSQVIEKMSTFGVGVGPWLGRWYPSLRDSFLVAISEIHSKKDLDFLRLTLARAL